MYMTDGSYVITQEKILQIYVASVSVIIKVHIMDHLQEFDIFFFRLWV